jgi:uncharacterized protein YcsI (UPF0317 family)
MCIYHAQYTQVGAYPEPQNLAQITTGTSGTQNIYSMANIMSLVTRIKNDVAASCQVTTQQPPMTTVTPGECVRYLTNRGCA